MSSTQQPVAINYNNGHKYLLSCTSLAVGFEDISLPELGHYAGNANIKPTGKRVSFSWHLREKYGRTNLEIARSLASEA